MENSVYKLFLYLLAVIIHTTGKNLPEILKKANTGFIAKTPVFIIFLFLKMVYYKLFRTKKKSGILPDFFDSQT